MRYDIMNTTAEKGGKGGIWRGTKSLGNTPNARGAGAYRSIPNRAVESGESRFDVKVHGSSQRL